MSGSHYNYACYKFLAMSEKIEEDLADEEAVLSDEIKVLMRQFNAELLHTARKAKALEWFMSGDYGEDDFKRVMAEPFNPEINIDSVWGV